MYHHPGEYCIAAMFSLHLALFQQGRYPCVCFSCLQFAVGSVFALMLWTVGLLKKPEFTKDTVRPNRILVASCLHIPETMLAVKVLLSRLRVS